MKNTSCGMILCIAVAMLVSVLSSAFLPIREQNIYDDVIRLHVIASSDDERDQFVKLAVRDAILEEAQSLFDGASRREAEEIAAESIDRLKAIADNVLRQNGCGYTSEISLSVEAFPTREYSDAVLPGGNYLSLCVRLGDAMGKNWWCVMFPPMCNGAAKSISSLQNSGDTATFSNTEAKPKFRLKLFLLELFN